MEDDLQWKTTFVARLALMADDLRWKITLNRKRPTMESDYCWRMIIEDDFQLKTTFD